MSLPALKSQAAFQLAVPPSLKIVDGSGAIPPVGPPVATATPKPKPKRDDQDRIKLSFDPLKVFLLTTKVLNYLGEYKDLGLCIREGKMVRVEAIGDDFRVVPITQPILRSILIRIFAFSKEGKECPVPQALLQDLVAQSPTTLASHFSDAATVIEALRSVVLLNGFLDFAKAKAMNRFYVVNPIYYEFTMTEAYVYLTEWLKIHKIDRPDNWPRGAAALGRRAAALIPFLDEFDVELAELKHKEDGNYWTIAAFEKLPIPEGRVVDAAGNPSVSTQAVPKTSVGPEGNDGFSDLTEETGMNAELRRREENPA